MAASKSVDVDTFVDNLQSNKFHYLFVSAGLFVALLFGVTCEPLKSGATAHA